MACHDRAVSLETPLWRAIAVFRVAALGYAGFLVARNYRGYTHPVAGWVVLAAMAVWTAYALYAYAAPRRRRWPLLTADLLVAAGCLVTSRAAIPADRLAAGADSLPMAWVAAPVLAWAVSGGRRRGAIAALVIGARCSSSRGSAPRRRCAGHACCRSSWGSPTTK
jgi:hypothetical protein